MRINTAETKRSTMQKVIVMKCVRELDNHPTAEMIYERAHEEYPSISRGTVIRILEQLVMKGEMLRISVENGEPWYDCAITRKYEVVCRKCGAVGYVELDEVPQLEKPYMYSRGDDGFVIDGCNVRFLGYCPDCATGEKAM